MVHSGLFKAGPAPGAYPSAAPDRPRDEWLIAAGVGRDSHREGEVSPPYTRSTKLETALTPKAKDFIQQPAAGSVR